MLLHGLVLYKSRLRHKAMGCRGVSVLQRVRLLKFIYEIFLRIISTVLVLVEIDYSQNVI